jgi:SNF2 family DNA or RNA helicase
MKEMLEDVMAANGKILIFSQFVRLLKLLAPELDKMNIPYCYLDGSMSSEKRGAEVQRFQENANIPVFLISLKAGGVGLNLTAADYVFLLDPWWNPAIEQQAINRAHRIGQTKPVFVYKFITKGTIEEKILKLQQHKMQIANEVIQTEEQFFKSLSKEDLEALFE